MQQCLLSDNDGTLVDSVFVEPQSEAMKSIIRKIGYDYGIEIVALEIPEGHLASTKGRKK